MKKVPAAEPPPCAVRNVAQVLSEEPRLEAVAFESRSRRLEMATLGGDPGARLAQRVSRAMGGSQCAIADGVCAACGQPFEARSHHHGVVVRNVLGGTLIEKPTCTTAIHFWKWSSLRWPKLVTRAPEPGHCPDEDEWRTLAALAVGCLMAGLAGLAAERLGAPHLALLFWAAAYVTGAWEAAQETWEKIRRGELDVHFLMLAVAAGAAAVGAWHEGALLLFLFSASGAMEHYASGRTQHELSALMRGAPKTATVLRPERELPVEALAPGMIVRLAAGEQAPADLRIVRGSSAFDESNLTGEARPVTKGIGDEVFAGTINGNGSLEGEILRPANESALQRIVNLIEHAQRLRAPAQRFTDRFGTVYTWVVLGLCTAMFCVWHFAFGLPAFFGESALYRAMTLLVVMSPCALVLSIPSAILSAIAFGARRGILFRGGAAIEGLAAIDAVALDKTGTLTAGALLLMRADEFAGSEADVRRAAFNLARFSDHPLSRAITTAGGEERPTERVETVPGQGVRGMVDGRLCLLGNRAFAGAEMTDAADADAEVWISAPGLLGRLTFEDEIRPRAAEVIHQLAARGVNAVMLTGDRPAAAEHLARELGISDVRAGLLPADKLAAIEALKAGGAKRVAMVGDGVNDAPSLAAADVSIAMGARGSDAALEQASVVLMNDRLENLLVAHTLSCRAVSVIRQNLAVALGTVVVMTLLSLFRATPLGLGVLAHEGSTALVVLNSLRLLFPPGRSGARPPTESF